MSALIHVIAAGEPSKLPFYAAGGAFAIWAVLVAALGLARPGFPGSVGVSRSVMGISALLMVAVMFTAVATASRPTREESRDQPPGKRQPPGPREGQVGGTSGGGGEPATPEQTGQAPASAKTAAGSSAAGSTLQVAADPSGQLAYRQKSLSAKAGRVDIQFDNRSSTPHDVTIEQDGRRIGATKEITSSKTSAAVQVRPGRYTFYCSVDSHRQAGMQGTLTVR